MTAPASKQKATTPVARATYHASFGATSAALARADRVGRRRRGGGGRNVHDVHSRRHGDRRRGGRRGWRRRRGGDRRVARGSWWQHDAHDDGRGCARGDGG